MSHIPLLSNYINRLITEDITPFLKHACVYVNFAELVGWSRSDEALFKIIIITIIPRHCPRPFTISEQDVLFDSILLSKYVVFKQKLGHLKYIFVFSNGVITGVAERSRTFCVLLLFPRLQVPVRAVPDSRLLWPSPLHHIPVCLLWWYICCPPQSGDSLPCVQGKTPAVILPPALLPPVAFSWSASHCQ